MSKKYAMLSIISDQQLPHIIALLQSQQKIEKVYFVISSKDGKYDPKYESKYNQLVEYLDPNQYSVSKLPAIDPYDIEDFEKKMHKELDLNKYKYIFNITGGTKPMSIAAYTVALRNEIECVYVDSQNNQIIRYPSGNVSKVSKEKFDMNRFKEIDLLKYFKLSGKPIKVCKDVSSDKMDQSTVIYRYHSHILESDFFKKLQQECRSRCNDRKNKRQKKLPIELDISHYDLKESDKEILKILSSENILEYKNNSV